MPGLFGVAQLAGAPSISKDIVDSIDLLNSGIRRTMKLPKAAMAAVFCSSTQAELGTIQTEEISGYLFGDPVQSDSIDWAELTSEFRRGEFGMINDIEGIFCFALYDKERKKLYLATDKIGMQPLHYAWHEGEILFSTAVPTFLRFGKSEIDPQWVSEFMFFNYPLSARTFLKGVNRVPPGCVVQVDLFHFDQRVIRYCPLLAESDFQLTGKAAIASAYETLSTSIPELLDRTGDNWISITAGLDSKMVAAFVPRDFADCVRMYTYGVPGCKDLLEGKRAADEYDIRHDGVELDQTFKSTLMDHMAETVWLSGGLQLVNRASLCFVYRALAERTAPFPVVLSGISGDHIFRDHQTSRGNVPHMIPPELSAYITKRSDRVVDTVACAAFAPNPCGLRNTVEYLESVFSDVMQVHGNPTDPAGYFSYLIYIVGPKYFGGELALARNFVRLRSPFWNFELLRRAYDMDCSTVGLSKRFPGKERFREAFVQANLISQASHGRRITYGGLPLDYFASGNWPKYQIARIGKRAIDRLARFATTQNVIRVEDWNSWFKEVGEQLDDSHGSDSLVRGYVNEDYIRSAVRQHDIRALAKLWSLELILAFVSNGWHSHRTAKVA